MIMHKSKETACCLLPILNNARLPLKDLNVEQLSNSEIGIMQMHVTNKDLKDETIHQLMLTNMGVLLAMRRIRWAREQTTQ